MKPFAITLIIALALSCAPTLAAKRATAKPAASPKTLVANIANWLSRPEIRHSRVGLEIMDCATGQILFEHNGTRRHTPASTAKILTTAALYDLMGGDYLYKTRLSTSGNLKDDTVGGDLYLESSQDPSLTRADLEALVASLKIKRVDGKVHLLAPEGSRDNFNINWLAEDFGQDWMPVSSSLVVDKNLAFTAGVPRTVKVEDMAHSNLSVLDSVLASDMASALISYDEASGIARTYRGLSYNTKEARVKKDGPFVVANPTDYNCMLFASSLSDNGIGYNRPILRSTSLPAGVKPLSLGEHNSKPLSQLIRLCLFESDNLYAQQFLRTLSGAGYGSGDKKGATRRAAFSLEERGLARMSDWLSRVGVPISQVVLFDGCGLSRKNAVTPHALNLTLAYMLKNKPQYLDLLRSSADAKGANRYRFKTGAMDTVRGLSGILECKGRNLAVTTLVNGHTPSVKDVRIVLADLMERVKNSELPAAAASK